MSLTTGDIIDDKYRIVRLIGEGGMGAVYEGENIRIHRKVAIKVLHTGVAENEDAVQRFEREAQAAGRIGSEHICEVLDLGNLANGDRFMVMEFMDGEDLSGRIKSRGKLSPADTYQVAFQLLEGLKAAHAAGIIHRDLKPDNVFLIKSRGGQEDFVKILDFGISKFSALSGESGFSMTRTGAVMGTPYYMSPEQAKGAKGMDARADLYSVGVILYECVTGQVPFNADTFNELLFKIVLETPAPIEEFCPDMDPAFSSVITKAMAREPAHRYQSAQEFQDALVGWASTGKGASIPPEVAQAPGARPPMPSVTGVPPVTNNTSTPGAWANTGSASVSPVATPKKSNTGLVAAAVIGGVVLIGGGAAAAFAMGGDGDPGPAAPGETAEAPVVPEEPEVVEEPPAEEKKDEPAEEKKDEPAEEKKDEPVEEKKDEPAATAERKQPATTRRGGGRSTSSKPKETDKPKPSTGSSKIRGGGRKIRTEL